MNSTTTSGFDFYYRSIDANGKTVVRETRVWDKDLFVASLQAAAEKENAGRKPGEKRLAGAQQITREQYVKERA